MAKAWVSRDALLGGESRRGGESCWGLARTIPARICDYSQRYPAPPRRATPASREPAQPPVPFGERIGQRLRPAAPASPPRAPTHGGPDS